MSESNREIAERIVQCMFSNGQGEGADRLLLIRENYSGAATVGNAVYLGGWSQKPLIDLIETEIAAERERFAKIAETRPESRFDLDHEPAPTEQQIRNGIATAIRGGNYVDTRSQSLRTARASENLLAKELVEKVRKWLSKARFDYRPLIKQLESLIEAHEIRRSKQ